jgi:hypothetical protein
MKALIALLIPVAALGAGARVAVRAPIAVRPLGAVYAPPPSTRPLGGVTTPRRNSIRNTAPAYVGPVYYIPNAYDSYSDYSSYAPPATPAAPVIVNQYFGTQGSSVPDAYNVADAAPPLQEAVSPGDPLTPPQNYYLIRYKDRSTFSALTYWLEGDTLHYVTTDNKHNQASLDLIDLDQTYKLNADHSVPFSIPGR